MTRRHPRWDPTCQGSWKRGADYMTEKGAHRLANMIFSAWSASGHVVRVQVVNTGHSEQAMWTVRTPDLVNGLPVKQVPA